jgi:hypothetical protein
MSGLCFTTLLICKNILFLIFAFSKHFYTSIALSKRNEWSVYRQVGITAALPRPSALLVHQLMGARDRDREPLSRDLVRSCSLSDVFTDLHFNHFLIVNKNCSLSPTSLLSLSLAKTRHSLFVFNVFKST